MGPAVRNLLLIAVKYGIIDIIGRPDTCTCMCMYCTCACYGDNRYPVPKLEMRHASKPKVAARL